MVGEGVLHTCLHDAGIEKVLVINRKSLGLSHPKLVELIHQDFLNINFLSAQLQGYDACFFCLGVSSIKMTESVYFRYTYTLTMHVAETLSKSNPAMTFCYVSGAGTDSSEQGRIRWARVKGKTENDLMKLPFKQVFAFRPGFIKPIKGLKNVLPFYKYVLWLFPIGRAFFPQSFVKLSEIGQAMIEVSRYGFPKPVLEGRDIIAAAKTYVIRVKKQIV